MISYPVSNIFSKYVLENNVDANLTLPPKDWFSELVIQIFEFLGKEGVYNY
jgi:hypothetical protein